MTDTVINTPAQGDYLGMSDAEIMNAVPPSMEVVEPASVTEETAAPEVVEEEENEDSAAPEGAADALMQPSTTLWPLPQQRI